MAAKSRSGFTLVELMVVVGLMGLMATIAIGSYSAITRGMNDRAAIDAAKSFAEAALQRANLDRTNTYIYLFNEVTKRDTDLDAGIVCGVAVAVRPVGRITRVPESGFYCDEFSDIGQMVKNREDEESEESAEESANKTFFRIYNITQPGFAVVNESPDSKKVPVRDLEDADSSAMHDLVIYGYRAKPNQGDGNAEFKPGDLYGQEFVVTRLPPGYVFSEQVQMGSISDLGQKQVGNVIEVLPTDTVRPSIKIYVRRPNGKFDQIGDTREQKGDGEK